jgi:hypothetical protein
MIEEKDFADQMARLALIFHPGRFEGVTGLAALDEYYNIIALVRRLPDLISAVNQIVREEDRQFFPKPGEIIKVMRSVALSNQAKENVRLLAEQERPKSIEQKENIRKIAGLITGKRME